MAIESEAQGAVVDEEQYYHDAQLGAMWSASRMLVPVVAALYGGIYFAYFYLRSLDSYGLWDPHGLTASRLIGSVIFIMVVVAAAVQFFANRRLRRGYSTDFLVGSIFAALLLFLAGAGQIWQLTRLPFLPGQFAYAGVFVAFGPVNAIVILLTLYWIVSLIMRGVNSYEYYRAEGGIGVSAHRAAENFRASLDGYTFFIGFFVIISLFSFYLFYVLA